MELISLPSLSETALVERSVPETVILAIRLVVTCLREACETVAEDTGLDRYDDSTSEGQLRWRRCRNRVRHVLDEGLVEALEDAVADITDNALVVRVDDCMVSFYSARNGIDQPDLSGASKTKSRVVTEMQLQIQGLEAPESPRRLVVVYEADDDGLTHAAAGMLETSTQWHWKVSTFERPGLTLVDRDAAASLPPAYDEQPEVALPDLELTDVDSDLPAYDAQPPDELPELEVFDDVEDRGQEEAGSGKAN
jgi:hypothetical protein